MHLECTYISCKVKFEEFIKLDGNAPFKLLLAKFLQWTFAQLTQSLGWHLHIKNQNPSKRSIYNYFSILSKLENGKLSIIICIILTNKLQEFWNEPYMDLFKTWLKLKFNFIISTNGWIIGIATHVINFCGLIWSIHHFAKMQTLVNHVMTNSKWESYIKYN